VIQYSALVYVVYDTIRKYELSERTQRLNNDDEFDSFKSIHQVYQPHPAWTVALSHPHLRKQAHLAVKSITTSVYVGNT
jgi:hypothetical protein